MLNITEELERERELLSGLTNDVWEERTDCFQTPLTDVSVLTFLPSHLLNCPRY